MEDENIKEDKWTSGTRRNMEKRTNQELKALYKDLDIVADIKKERLE